MANEIIDVTLNTQAPTIEIVTPLQVSAKYLEIVDKTQERLDALGLSVVDGKIHITYTKEDDEDE